MPKTCGPLYQRGGMLTKKRERERDKGKGVVGGGGSWIILGDSNLTPLAS